MDKNDAHCKVPSPCLALTMSLLLCSALALIVSLADVQAVLNGKAQHSASQQRHKLNRAFKNESFPPCKTKVMSDEVLVKFKEPVPVAIVQELVNQALINQLVKRRAFRFEEVGTGETLYLIHVEGFRVIDLLAFFTSLNSRKQKFRVVDENEIEVEYAQPNFVFYKADAPDDPKFKDQWALLDSDGTNGGISVVSAWRTSTGSNKIVVGVVDTGISFQHPDLDGNIWRALHNFNVRVGGQDITCHKDDHGFNAPAGNCDPTEFEYHGTRVAGIIGAEGNNNQGVAGVNWTTSIMGLRYIDDKGNTNEADIVNAIKFAIEVKKQAGLADIRVLNNSYGYQTTRDAICRPTPLAEAIQAANDAEILFVAAAGDDGDDNDETPFYPANLAIPNVISVAATTSSDNLLSISNWGLTTVHLGAPGGSIITTNPPDKYNTGSGTSFSAPFVSGAAALILSKPGCEKLKPTALKECILDNADRVLSLRNWLPMGRRLNVKRAIDNCERYVR